MYINNSHGQLINNMIPDQQHDFLQNIQIRAVWVYFFFTFYFLFTNLSGMKLHKMLALPTTTPFKVIMRIPFYGHFWMEAITALQKPLLLM